MLAQPYDWILRCSAEILLILIFVFILLRPLWKLVQGRLSLIIVFSKAIANLIRLLIDMPSFLTNYIVNFSPSIYVFISNGFLYSMETVLTTHILAMAINRAHAMIFPFHYNSFSTKKRNFYAICALLWIFSLCTGFLNKNIREWTNNSVNWLYLIVQQICMACAALCYTIIGCKMFWLKYFSAAASSGAQTEKDSLKIMLICFTSLFMASLRFIILNPIIPSTQSWPDLPHTMFYWLTFASVLLAQSGEELCMLLLLRDYRKGVAEQILGFFGKKHTMAPSTTTITNVALFKKMPVIVNSAPPKRNLR